jgi:hypothetical protein
LGEPAEPFGFGGLVGLDFHADYPPVGGFQDDVNLCARAILPVEHSDVGGCPGELPAEFGEDEGLDKLTRRGVFGVNERGRGLAEQPGGEPRIGQEDLGVSFDPAGEVA